MGRRLYERFSRNGGENTSGIPEIVDTYLAVYYRGDQEIEASDIHCLNGASYQITTESPWQNTHFCFTSEGQDIQIVAFVLNIEQNHIPQIDHRLIDKAIEELEQSPGFIVLNEKSESFFLQIVCEFQVDFYKICMQLKDGERRIRDVP